MSSQFSVPSSPLSGQWPVVSGQQLTMAEWEQQGDWECIDPSSGWRPPQDDTRKNYGVAQDDTRKGKNRELETGNRELAREVAGVLPASRLGERPRPAMASSGVAAVDALTGGLPRGGLTEICGAASSGRTSLLLAALAAATARGEVCALVDAGDRFDPQSAQAAGVDLRRVLWVRCGKSSQFSSQRRSGQWPVVSGQRDSAIGNRQSALKKAEYSILEQALKATDLLLQAGGFGMVVMDLGDVPSQAARRVPLASWFRFRRAVEHTDTVLVAVTRETCAKSCAGVVVELSASGQWSVASGQQAGAKAPVSIAGEFTGLKPGASTSGASTNSAARSRSDAETDASTREIGNRKWEIGNAHARLLGGLEVRAAVVRDAVQGKKPVQSAAQFASETCWNRVIGPSRHRAIG